MTASQWNVVPESCRWRRHRQIVASSALVGILLVMGGAAAGASIGSTVNEPKYGFSFAIPKNWTQVPLDGSNVKALLNVATHDDPTLTNALNSEIVSESSKGMKAFAIGPTRDSAAPNVNVIVASTAGAPSGKAFAQAAEAEEKIGFAEIHASHIKASIVNNRLGNVAQTSYQLPSKSFGTEVGIQYYARHGSHLYIVTITASSLSGAQSYANFIVGSWRW